MVMAAILLRPSLPSLTAPLRNARHDAEEIDKEWRQETTELGEIQYNIVWNYIVNSVDIGDYSNSEQFSVL